MNAENAKKSGEISGKTYSSMPQRKHSQYCCQKEDHIPMVDYFSDFITPL